MILQLSAAFQLDQFNFLTIEIKSSNFVNERIWGKYLFGISLEVMKINFE